MGALEDHYESLSGWLKSHGVPPWDRVLFSEDIYVDPLAKQVIQKYRFYTLEEYSNRFDDLLKEGYSWLNFSGLGLLNGTLIVVIDKPNRSVGSSFTSVSQSGPSNCVKENNYNLEKFIEIGK